MANELTDVDVELIHETEKAFLVSHDGETETWIPKSKCEFEASGKTNGRRKLGVLTLESWLAEEKGFV